MARHWTDFAEYLDANLGSQPEDWEPVMAGVVDDFIVGGPDARGDSYLRQNYSSGQNKGIGWSTPDLIQDAEVLVKTEHSTFNSGDEGPGCCVRAIADGSTYGWGYILTVRHGTGLRLGKAVGSSHTTIQDVAFAMEADRHLWMRLRAVGLNVQGKAWWDGDEEPDWMIDVSDSDITDPGLVGVTHGIFNPEPYSYWYGFGATDDPTNESAPGTDPALEADPLEGIFRESTRAGSTLDVPDASAWTRGPLIPDPSDLAKRPRIDYGTVLDLSQPILDWAPGKEELASKARYPSGAREAYTVNRWPLLDLTLRVTEDEWPSFMTFVETVQSNASSFTIYPDRADLLHSYLVHLRTPALGDEWFPTRDAEIEGVYNVSLILESADGTHFDLRRLS